MWTSLIASATLVSMITLFFDDEIGDEPAYVLFSVEDGKLLLLSE